MRFSFNGNWEKYKLKEFTSRVTRKNKENVTNRPLTISAQFGLIDQNDFFDKQIASKDMSGYYLLLNGEFAYNKSYSNDYPLGAVKRLDKYPNGALSSLYICFSVYENKIDSDFLAHYFETSKWHKGIINIAGEGARNHGLLNMSVDDYFDTTHFIPSLPEQKKISELLNKIVDRINTQSKIINKLESLIYSLRNEIFSKYDWKCQRLDSFVNNGTITLKRGNVIPKHERNEEYKFPVYSSSIHNNGLMGFNNSYMFDKELITWSVDGGGNFFYRPKHKFNVTNVCGILEVKDYIFNYRFLCEILSAQHSKMIFDYQTKAHPSVIEKLYKLPIVDIEMQEKIALIFELCYQKLEKEKDILSLYKKQKAYLLQNMFI